MSHQLPGHKARDIINIYELCIHIATNVCVQQNTNKAYSYDMHHQQKYTEKAVQTDRKRRPHRQKRTDSRLMALQLHHKHIPLIIHLCVLMGLWAGLGFIIVLSDVRFAFATQWQISRMSWLDVAPRSGWRGYFRGLESGVCAEAAKEIFHGAVHVTSDASSTNLIEECFVVVQGDHFLHVV